MKRLRGILISGAGLAAFARAGSWVLKIESPIPEDAEFFTAYFDNARNAFVAVFEHESFALVAEASVIPISMEPVDISSFPCEDFEPPLPVTVTG